jgi:hypothetical protein
MKGKNLTKGKSRAMSMSYLVSAILKMSWIKVAAKLKIKTSDKVIFEV